MNKELYKECRKQLNFDFKASKLILYFAQEIFLYAATYWLLQQSFPLSLLAALPVGAIMFRNFSFMHEATHGVAHANSKINYLLGVFAGSVCFLPYSLWKTIHVEHHFWAGNFDKDPAMALVKRYPSTSPFTKNMYQLLWKIRFPWMALFQYLVFWEESTVRLIKKPQDGLAWLNYVMPCLFWGGLIANFDWPQLGVIAFGLLLYGLLFDYINLPHHVGKYSYDPHARINVWDQHEIARTGRYPLMVESFLLLNFNYHAEHHMFPDLPWHELRNAHQLLHTYSKDYEVVDTQWLRKRREKPFSAFIRPDLTSTIKKAA